MHIGENMNSKWYVSSILLFLCLVSIGSAATEDLTPISAFPSLTESTDEFGIESVSIMQAAGFEEQVTTDSLYREYPKTDGTYITWVEWDVTSKIWYYDTVSQSRNQISSTTSNQNYPDIDAGIAVWQESGTKKSIMSASLSPYVEAKVVYASETTATKPAIYGDRVVWEEYAGSDYTNVYYKRIGDTYAGPLSKSSNQQSNPKISGDYVVWQELDSGTDDWNIYLFHLSTGEKRQLTRDKAAQIHPDISGNLVVWEDHRDGYSNIMVYDIERDITTAVTYDEVSNVLPAVSNNIIVWSRMGTDGYNIYMVNLAGPTTYLVAKAPGDQLYADIGTDIIVWQDTRFGGSDIFSYKLEPETKYRSYLFYGLATQNFQPMPVGSVIEAKIDGVTKGTITVTEEGRYGSKGETYGTQLTVPITQQDLGKSITFWSEGIEGLPRIQISGDGGMVEWPLEFTYAGHLDEISLYGTVKVDGVAAPVGTVLSAAIGGVTRGQYTITESGYYGSPNPSTAGFVIPITEQDLGKPLSFIIGDVHADQSFFVQESGTFALDLSGTKAETVTPYEFYGYVYIDSGAAASKTKLSAKIRGREVSSYVMESVGSYGGPGDNPFQGRFIVPYTRDDIGSVITFETDGKVASEQVVITNSGERVLRQDITFNFGPAPCPGIPAFTSSSHSGSAPLQVQFYDNSAGSPVSWDWNFGDGTTSKEQNPVHMYSKPGSYTVTLTIYDQSCGYSTTVVESYVVVLAQPVPPTATSPPYPTPTRVPGSLMASFEAVPLSGSAPLTVQFVDLSIGNPTLWVWSFGDGTPDSLEQYPTHTFTNPGTYTVTLEVANAEFYDAMIKTQYITVSGQPVPPTPTWAPQPTPTLAPQPTPPPAPGTISLNLYPGWNFVSIPTRLAPGYDTAMIFNEVNVVGHSIFEYDASTQQWKTLRPDTQMHALSSVWIYSEYAMTVSLHQNQDPLQTPPVKQLYMGWNAVGPGTSPIEAKFSFLSVQNEWVNCLGYNNQNQQYDDMIIKGKNDERMLYPGSGYWLFMNADGVLAGSSA